MIKRQGIAEVLLLFVFAISACKSQQTTAEKAARQARSGPPSIDEIFKMDTNQDGYLSINEVKGPLKNDFTKVDLNKDGLISREEFEAAPKPDRKKGGQGARK